MVLVADLDIEETMKGLLEARSAALGIRRVAFKILRDTLAGHDGGTFKRAHELLHPASHDPACRALVLFDRDWKGAPSRDPRVLAEDVERRLRPAWGERARSIVLDPEIEVWVFSDSPHVEKELGFRSGELRPWLRAEGLWPEGLVKPPDPKAAMHHALKKAKLKISASRFSELARKVSLERCTDPSFRALREVLQGWFAVESMA